MKPRPRGNVPSWNDWDEERPAVSETAAHRATQAPEAELRGAEDFEQLYALYFGFTWRVLRHLGVPAYAIDDAVQEVWIVVHQRLEAFQGRSSLKTWLFGIAFNVMRNHRRADQRRDRLLTTSVTVSEPPIDPELERVGREAWERVERFLSTLDDENRAIFVSSLLEQLPAKEAAEATGIEVSTVYQRMRTLRNRFKAWLDATLEPKAGA